MEQKEIAPEVTEEEKKLTKNQKLKQKRKARKARAKGEEEANPEEEIKWCIDQIKLGIECNKLDRDQLKESNSALEVLTSEKVPLVKKRQLMHTIFGDYRKLMRDPRFQLKKDSVVESVL